MPITTQLGRFAIVPEWLAEAASPRALQWYTVVWIKWADWETKTASVTHQRIADAMGCGVTTARDAMRELVKLEAVRVVQRFEKKAGQVPNSYELITVKGVPAKRDGGGGQPTPKINIGDKSLPKGRESSDTPEVEALLNAAYHEWRQDTTRKKIANPDGYRRDVTAARRLLKAEYTVETVRECARVMRADDWYRKKLGLSVSVLAKNVETLRAAGTSRRFVEDEVSDAPPLAVGD